MLTRKLGVFVVYGHDLALKKDCVSAIERLASGGYRVRALVVDDESSLIRDSDFRKNLIGSMNAADAAVILLTFDDLGISKRALNDIVETGEPLDSTNFEQRPRQNAVWEYGFLASRLRSENYIIVVREHTGDLFSDTDGTHLIALDKFKDIYEVIEKFARERLALRPEPDPLTNPDWKVSYHNLVPRGNHLDDEQIIEHFDTEYAALDTSRDRALYLLERIVFDSYLSRPQWWQTKINDFDRGDSHVNFCWRVLKLIQRYMAAWSTPTALNHGAVADALEETSELLKIIKSGDYQLAPIVSICLYDYAGLIFHKIGLRRKLEENKQDAITHLTRSAECLQAVLELSRLHEDENLPLWRGYAAYNLARVQRELVDLDSNAFDHSTWQRTFQGAMTIRRAWKDVSAQKVFLPYRVRDGLEAEYIHCLVTRAVTALRDDGGNIIETGDYSVGEEFDHEVKAYYNEWHRKPSQNRVRLGSTIIANFTKHDSDMERRKLERKPKPRSSYVDRILVAFGIRKKK